MACLPWRWGRGCGCCVIGYQRPSRLTPPPAPASASRPVLQWPRRAAVAQYRSPPGGRKPMLRQRVFSGAVLLAVVLIIIAVRGPLLELGVAGGGGHRRARILQYGPPGGYVPWRWAACSLTLVLVVEAALVALDGWRASRSPGRRQPGLGLLVVALICWAALLLGASRGEPPAAGLGQRRADGGRGALYRRAAALRPAAANRAPGEVGWLLLVLVGTAGSDTGAYFVGRAWGRRKLIPHISPGKTWVGLAGAAWPWRWSARRCSRRWPAHALVACAAAGPGARPGQRGRRPGRVDAQARLRGQR